ncbi:class I SAM-dependent methyltransferase [Yinghuangia seranimata]|uniref:class I SAM-dependent methyltransferase n=1 Tax=Yinghuangia seranimata TaxID=408067 RepID=UPI00248C5F85|nr:class I SAM-dependent methyltransferase [Yinghuangia seranimata]MDI2129122.1 class I SAM-dependent methyltransferase [Yinghuangia seranimata]
MPTPAPYDAVADWYETEFLTRDPSSDGHPLGLGHLLDDLLGPGTGPCLEIGCGTGVHADRVRALGWTPFGLDLSHGMLRHAHTRGRLPVVCGDAARLPVASVVLLAAVAVMVHTDMPDYPRVLREVARVLRPGGVFVHIGVHPCFCGGFADRSDPDAILVRPGYLDGAWTRKSWTAQGVRDKVGATHLPLPALLGAFVDAGLRLERFAESGSPTPIVFAVRAVRARR